MAVPTSIKNSRTHKAKISLRATRKNYSYKSKYYHRLQYISKIEHLIKGSGLESKKVQNKDREYLNSLPFVLKHSLFMEDIMIQRMRELSDFGQQFFIADDTKIKGNTYYDQGQYYKALEVYEQVLGCYVWLEFLDSKTKSDIFEKFEHRGIVDTDIEIKTKQVVREADREIEIDTCKHTFLI